MPAPRHYTTYTKAEILKSTAIMANQKTIEAVVYLSKIKFDDSDDKDTYIVCKHCGGRFAQIDQHLKKWHKQTPQEYLKEFPDAELVCKFAQDRVKGDKNPSYQHGGKYSKFSDNFIHYEGMTDEEIAKSKLDVANKSKETKQANPQNENTKIEYYLARGMTTKEAQDALSNRQTTFSLEICIEKFGFDEGMRVWKERQEKWAETLGSKSPEEISAMNKKKSNQSSMNTYFSSIIDQEYDGTQNITGTLYFIKIKDGYYKIGITTKDSASDRYPKNSYEEILYESGKADASKIAKIEKIIKTIHDKYGILKENEIYPFGWTETLSLTVEQATKIINQITQLMKLEQQKIDLLFGRYVCNQ